MKSFIKENNTLSPSDTSLGKYYSSESAMNSDISNILENEVVFVKGKGIFQKIQNSMTAIAQMQASGGVIGEIIAFYGDTNPDPSSFIVCDGSQFSSSDFPELYSILGTDYAPDLTHYSLKGVGEKGTIPYGYTHDIIYLRCKVPHRLPAHAHTVCNTCHKHSISDLTHYHTVNCKYTCVAKCCYYSTSCTSAVNAYTSLQLCASTSSASFQLTICSADAGPFTFTGTTNNDTDVVNVGNETKTRTKNVMFLIRGK